MAFGQQAGPPATAKQLDLLLTLLRDAGHSDFRDARGPMGFTQRQANGKFTRDEADAFIEHLETAAEAGVAPERIVPERRTSAAPRATPAPSATTPPRTSATPPRAAGASRAAGSATNVPATKKTTTEAALRRVPAELLAAELQRRGWVVLEP